MSYKTLVTKNNAVQEPRWFQLTDTDLDYHFGYGGVYFVEVSYLKYGAAKPEICLGVLSLLNWGNPTLHVHVNGFESLQKTYCMFRQLQPEDVFEVRGERSNDDIPF